MKNKIGIIIIFILITISLFFSLIYLPYIDSNSTYVIVENNTIWKNNNGIWSNSNLRNLKRISFEEFYSFSSEGYIGKTYLDYDNELKIYNSNFEEISLTNGILSVKTNTLLKNTTTAKFYDEIDDADYPYIEEVLNKYSINYDSYMTSLKYTIDLNNDGEEDTIYSISNFYTEEDKAQAFSIIFSVINSNIEIIDYVIVDEKEELKTKASYLRYIADVDYDNNYEFIILKTSYGDVKNDCYIMYKYHSDSNKYIKLIGC